MTELYSLPSPLYQWDYMHMQYHDQLCGDNSGRKTTPRSYNIDKGGRIIRRNRAQIRPAVAPTYSPKTHPLQPYTTPNPVPGSPPVTSNSAPEPPFTASSAQSDHGEITTQTEEIQQHTVQNPFYTTRAGRTVRPHSRFRDEFY